MYIESQFSSVINVQKDDEEGKAMEQYLCFIHFYVQIKVKHIKHYPGLKSSSNELKQRISCKSDEAFA